MSNNTRNMNQANNFWDFVASLQNNQGASPFAEGRGSAPDFDPFQGQEFWGPWAHHGRRNHHGPPHPGPHGHRHGRDGQRGPPPPPEHSGSAPPPPPPAHEHPSRSSSPHTPPETPAEPHHHPRSRETSPPPHHHPGGHRRPSPPPHGHHRGLSPHHHRGRGRPERGGHGPRGYGPRSGHHNRPHGPPHPPAFPFDLNALAEAFAPALFGSNNPFANNQTTNEVTKTTNDGTFTPAIDLFSTPTSYIIHASLPGAKKPELDITYSGTRNSITISGVVARPDVSETMMNCLVTDERREVGIFEREIKLEEGVKIDEERIGAKLEDGVLRVVVPKIVHEEEEGWESVRKVELE